MSIANFQVVNQVTHYHRTRYDSRYHSSYSWATVLQDFTGILNGIKSVHVDEGHLISPANLNQIEDTFPKANSKSGPVFPMILLHNMP